MQSNKDIIPGLLNITRVYSPITLNSEWSTLARLAFLVFCSCFGVTTNGYYVSSFFVEGELRKMCFVYLGCCGLSDMLITVGIIPISAVALISKVWDVPPVCQFVQLLAATSTYSYSIFFALLAGEICHRVHITDQKAEGASHAHKPYIIVSVMLFSITLAGVGTYLHLDYDYCERRFYGNFYFRTITSCLVHGTSFLLTMVLLIISYNSVEQLKRLRIQYRIIEIKLYSGMIKLNICVYLLYVVCWTPYLVIVYWYPNAADDLYYYYAWVGVSRTLITSSIYGFLNTTFGRTYANMFIYCCFKSNLYDYRANRPRRTTHHARAGGNRSDRINVHIMQTAMTNLSPQRASTSARDREALDL